MKKVLLFAIIALSINASAQSKHPLHHKQQTAASAIENIQSRLMDSQWKTHETFSRMSPVQSLKHQKAELLSLIQLVDSSYSWQWNVIGGEWDLNSKIIDAVYDSHNNLLSNKRQNWTGSSWVDTIKTMRTYDASNNVLSLLSKNWDGSAWVNGYQQTFTYGANSNWSSFSFQVWDGSAWSNYYKLIWTYDANNNQTSEIWQFGNGSDWMNFSKSTWTYDSQNNMTLQMDQNWNTDITVWEDSYKSMYEYDIHNNNTVETDQSWNLNLSVWENFSKYIYTYDSFNNRISETEQYWNADISAWETNERYLFTYDANNNLINVLNQGWDGSNWENSMQYVLTYNNNNLILELDQSWIFGEWIDTERYIYTYDANNNQTSELDQTWDGSSLWFNYNLYIANYDANSFKTGESYKSWNYAGTEVEITGDSTQLYYHLVQVGLPDLMESIITVYPNPTDGRFTISSKSALNAFEIYNLSGERVYSDYNCSRQTSKEIDLSGYAKGIYMVKIHNGTKNYSRKVVVQ